MRTVLDLIVRHLAIPGIVPLILIGGTMGPAQAKVLKVWAVNDGEKVYRYQAEHPGRNMNSVWDGERIRLRGLYNEILGFQVIVETDTEGAEALELHVSALADPTTGKMIGGSTGPKYGPEGTIEIFTEHYIHVERPTPKAWFYGAEASAPPRGTGWIPDPLIPPNAPRGKGGFPIDIEPAGPRIVTSGHERKVLPAPAVQNQGFWVDVHLPRNRVIPSGLFQGTVSVTSGGEVVAAIPVELLLENAYLPDENHSRVWLYTSQIAHYFPELSQQEVDRMVKFESHRHRIEAVGGFKAHQSSFDPTIMESYAGFLNGDAYTPVRGYRGPGEGIGETLFPIGMYGSKVLGDTREKVQSESNRWVDWFEEHAPGVEYFWYLVDEPGESYYDWIRERAAWVDSNTGKGARLPVFITTGYIEALKDAIDIWCKYDGVELDRLPEIRNNSQRHWFYNGFRPRYGSVLLEAEAVDFRVNAWAKYIHDVDTWFLWEGTHWTHNHSGPKGFLHQRVFSEPITFSSWSGTNVNGDGIVFYPGRMPYYPKEDRGLNELLGSIRLKNIRRGQQDAGLMWLAEQKEGRTRVLELVKEVVPQSFESDTEAPVAWSQRGDDYERIRELLLDLIVEKGN
ncbi:MAG: DUF4091 domain-containing protein [Acidobacteriota bacterium]|nr:MAG: DUF4091 domain-containing protein [Acidobacteriota bacterium]